MDFTLSCKFFKNISYIIVNVLEIPSSAVYDANDLLDEPLQTSVFKQEREEPEKIKMWREEQKKRLEEKGN